MCDRMFPEEIDQVEKYVGGLPDTIHGSVMATKPKTMQDAIEFATELMDKKINTWAERQADNKGKGIQEGLPKQENNNNGVIGGHAKDLGQRCMPMVMQGANPDNNVVTGTFLLNNRYASILFDTGADRSFVSTAFSSRIVITPTALDHDYNVELADGRILFKIFAVSFMRTCRGIPPPDKWSLESIGDWVQTPVARAHIDLARIRNEGTKEQLTGTYG
ncbi:putative reverse transcriptase domain-containing protein [Tanacetum coccineum]